jgi:hypothetical protein
MSYLINPSISVAPSIIATYIGRGSVGNYPVSSFTIAPTYVGGAARQSLIVITITTECYPSIATLTSVTIGGQAATIAVQRAQFGTAAVATGINCAIAYVNYTGSSLTPSIVVTYDNNTYGCTVGLTTILNNTNVVPITTASTGGTTTTATPLIVNFTGLPSTNKIFIAVSGNGNFRSNSWTSSFPTFTERFDTYVAGGSLITYISMASSASPGSTVTSGFVRTTLSGSIPSSTASCMCVVVIQ